VKVWPQLPEEEFASSEAKFATFNAISDAPFTEVDSTPWHVVQRDVWRARSDLFRSAPPDVILGYVT
jgi:hypothetical protein